MGFSYQFPLRDLYLLFFFKNCVRPSFFVVFSFLYSFMYLKRKGFKNSTTNCRLNFKYFNTPQKMI